MPRFPPNVQRRAKQCAALGRLRRRRTRLGGDAKLFLRGEFEFIQFAPITNINVPIVNGRVGAGFKF